MITTISCVIPALNEENNIEDLIASIRFQQFDKTMVIKEIIVVDNGSKDKTASIAKGLGAKVFIEPDLTIGALRNFGAKKAQGEVLIFLDADNVLEKSVISKIVNHLFIENTGAVGVPLKPHGDPTWVEKTWYYHIHTYKKGLNKAGSIASGAFGIKRKLFIGAGGFDERLKVGEDTELSKRIKKMGYQIFLDPECIIFNKGFPKTLLAFLKVEIWHGDSIKSLMIHKNIDLLSVYFLCCLGSIGMALCAILGFVPIWSVFLPLVVIAGPAFLKVIQRQKKIDLQFVQLFVIYIVYIIGRTISILKL